MPSPSLASSPQQEYTNQNVATPDHSSFGEVDSCPRSDRYRHLCTTPASVANEQHESLSMLPKTRLATPSNLMPAEAPKIRNYKGLKRQRSFESRNVTVLPSSLPGFPELDGTVKSNPYRRHLAIHSPIAGIRETLNLEFIADIKPSMSSERQVMFPLGLPSEAGYTRLSSKCSMSYYTVSSKELDKIRQHFPILEDCQMGSGTRFGDTNQSDDDIGVGTRTLKMRCQRRNDVIDPMALVT